MKNLITASLLTLITLPSFGFISQKSINNSVQKARIKNAAQLTSSNEPTGQSTTCADLAGTWDGECRKPDGTAKKTKIKIVQSQCLGLKVITMEPYAEDSFVINVDMTGIGISSTANSSIFASFNASYAGRWNTDKTVASIELAAVVNSPFLNSAQVAKGSIQFLRKNDKLVQFSKYEGFASDDGDDSCEYSKVN